MSATTSVTKYKMVRQICAKRPVFVAMVFDAAMFTERIVQHDLSNTCRASLPRWMVGNEGMDMKKQATMLLGVIKGLL